MRRDTPTPREELLRALLHCDKAGHDFQRALVDSAVGRVHIAELAGALRELLQVAEMLEPSSPEYWRATGYGLPPWLCTDLGHGAGLVYELLTKADWLDQVTGHVDGTGHPVFGQDDVNLFVDVLIRLDQVQQPSNRPTLLPGRIGDPALGYRDLVNALLGEQETALAAWSGPSFASGAAAAGLTARFASWGSGRPVGRELLARLLRVDVPVVHSGGVGMVLGLEVELSAPDDPREARETYPMGGTKVTRAFQAGVTTGHIQALKLLQSIGAPEVMVNPVRSLRFRLTEVAEGSPDAVGDSAGLPVALHVVAHVLDLERPPWVATGSFEKDETLMPIGHDAAEVKAAAVEADGLWQGLIARFERTPSAGRLFPLTGSTLAEACEQIWPEAWPRARARIASLYLADAGCTIQVGVPPDPQALTDDHGVPIGVQAPPHDQVVHCLRAYPAMPVVLAGPPAVGKSWTIRSVARELERAGWSVLVLRFRENHLPPPAEAARCADLALDLYARAPRTRSLLIIEDLVASPDATDLESVLLEILGACRCPVAAVVVAQQGSALKWKQRALHVVGMPLDTGSFAELAQSLVKELPERFGAAAGREGLVAAAAAGDRWWLVRLLDYAGRHGGTGDLTPIGLRRAYLRDRAGDLDPDQWQAVDLLATYSAIALPAPARELRALNTTQLHRLGAYQTVSGPDVYWRLPSPAARSTILGRDGNAAEQQLRAPLRQILSRLLDGAQMGPVVDCLYHLGGVYDARLLNFVSKGLRDLLVRRLKERASALELARAIPLLSGLEEFQDELVQQMAEQLACGWPTRRVSELVTCLRVLEAHYAVLALPRSNDELADLWEDLFHGLEQALRPLGRTMTPNEALGLLNTLERLRLRPDLTVQVITFLCIEGLSRVDPGRSADVFVALTMADVARQLSRRGDRQPNTRTPLEELVNSNGWRRLTSPHRGVTNASNYLARLALRDLASHTGEADPTAEEVETQLFALLPRTPLAEFVHTVYLLRKRHSLALRLLRRVRLDLALEGRINVESPHAVANLLLLLVRLQPRTAERLLYEPNGQPRAALVDHLVLHVAKAGDLRMLSFLLEAAGAVDQEFFRGNGGFGEMVVARLRPMFEHIRGERGRVVLNLTRGLISVDFDREHLQALRPQYHRYLTEAFAKESFAGEEAELALMLAADDVLDGAFRAELREAMETGALSRSDLLYRMKRGQAPDALLHYHALAMALDPSMAASYRDTRPATRTLVGSLRKRDLPSVLDAVRAVGRTLAYAGDYTAVHELLIAYDGTPQGWAERLLRLKHPGDLARAVNLLTALDPQLARSALEEASHDPGKRAGGRLLTNILKGRAQPEEALELLAAVRSVHPEIARQLAEHIAADERVWRLWRRGLVQIEHPAVLGLALYRLAVLGLGIDAQDRRNLEWDWAETIGHMASPWTVGHFLQGTTAVDASLGFRLAGRVDADRLRSRLARIRGGDGGGIGILLRAMSRAGRQDVADSIAGQFVSTPLTALSPGQAVSLCRAVLDMDSSARPELARRLHQDVLLPALDRQLVPDPDEHLLAIGWLARLLDRLGYPPPRRRWASQGREHSAARLWAETWLAPTPERTAEVNGLLDDVAACSRPTRPWRSALVLVAAAQAGRLADAMACGLDQAAAREADTEWQAEMDAVPELRRPR
jgi:hypothetical protein